MNKKKKINHHLQIKKFWTFEIGLLSTDVGLPAATLDLNLQSKHVVENIFLF